MAICAQLALYIGQKKKPNVRNVVGVWDFWFFLQEKLHAHQIPRFRWEYLGFFFVGGGGGVAAMPILILWAWGFSEPLSVTLVGYTPESDSSKFALKRFNFCFFPQGGGLQQTIMLLTFFRAPFFKEIYFSCGATPSRPLPKTALTK